MKRYLYLLILVFGLSSCSALGELTKFDMPFTQSVTISKAVVIPNATIQSISTPEIETKSADFFTKNNINPDLVEKIALREMKLTIAAPADGNFNFLKTIEISIWADGLDEIQIASLTDIPANGSKDLILNVDKTDIKQYILKDKIKFKITLAADESIQTDYTVDLKPIFLVDVKVLGL